MPVALQNKINLIAVDFFDELNDYVDYLIFKSHKKDTVSQYSEEFWSLFGKGKNLDLQIPEEAEFTADELWIEA